LVLSVDEPEYLEKANLRFYQKANLLRATIFHEDGDEGWPLVLAFNKLRNTIAHGDANEERTVQIEVLRGMLLPIVTDKKEASWRSRPSRQQWPVGSWSMSRTRCAESWVRKKLRFPRRAFNQK
jgi:hypothetical protein